MLVNWELAATLGLNALSMILILSLAALGLVIIFGFMGVINLAHGAFFILGAYAVWTVSTVLGLSFWIGFILAPFIVAVVGYITERLVVQYLYHRLLDTILATWGVAIVIQETLKITVGATSKRVDNPLPGQLDLYIVTFPIYRLFLMALSIVTLLAIFSIFYKTDYGVKLRAVIQDDEMASILGINTRRMNQTAFASGAWLAGLAGAALAPMISVSPEAGITYLVQSFLIIILGGTGSLIGVVPGSIVVGGMNNILSFFIQPVVAYTLTIVTVIVLIVIKPSGIMGAN